MTATPVPPPDPPLLPPEEKFWQRHSPHQEFPLSGVATVLVHLLVLFVIVLIAGVRGCTGAKDEGSLPIVAMPVGGDEVPGAAPGHRGDDRDGPEIQQKPLPETSDPLPTPPKPVVRRPDDPVDVPQLERPRTDDPAGDLIRKIDRTL